MDILAEVLDAFHVQSSVYCRATLHVPWGIEFTAYMSMFHVVLEGACWLRVSQENTLVYQLHAGDVIVLLHGGRHQVIDRLDTPIMRYIQVRENTAIYEPCPLLGNERDGVPTDLICGICSFPYQEQEWLLSALPEVIVIKGSQGQVATDLERTLRALDAETRMQRSGSSLIVRHLADILLIQVLRTWAEKQTDGTGGWLGALRDPFIGKALQRIHASPEHPWKVGELAQLVGLSRSLFADRFHLLVGESPGRYITRWRMQQAAKLLRESDFIIAEIALRVGYESEAAFSVAFKRRMNVSPGGYRRQNRSASHAE